MPHYRGEFRKLLLRDACQDSEGGISKTSATPNPK